MRVSPWLRYFADVNGSLSYALWKVTHGPAAYKTTVYLCGGINGLSDGACKNWRATAREELGRFGLRVLDPMDRDYRGREDECVEEIVYGDVRDILASNVLLVNASRPSWGTAMEVMLAWMLRFFLVRVVVSIAFRKRCRGAKRIVAFMDIA